MEVKTDKRIWVKILSTLGIIGVLVPMVYVLATTAISAFAAETSTVETKTYQEGCSIRVESTESVSWNLPRQPIDLVILQDASGSFEDNMPKIQTALKTLTSSTTEENYDENNPKLVFTNDPTTTDRVMLANYGGLDYIKNYDNVSRTTTATGFNAPASNYSYYSYTDSYGYIQYAYYYDFILVDDVSVQKAGVIETDYYGNKYFIPAGAFNIFTGYYVSSNAPLVQLNGTRAIGNYTNYKSTVTGTDSNFTNLNSYTSSTGYRYDASGLLTSNAEIDSKIDSIVTGGGTPTVPAVEDAIASYEAVKNTGGGMANNRKTVFLLITDGVANGYRTAGDSTVYMDRSLYRAYNLANDWATNGYLPEASQNYLARAKELEVAGDKLKAAVGADGKVVIGFFEDLKWLETFKSQGAPAPLSGYGYAYQNGFGNPGSNTTITTGDSRSVQDVFHTSLQSMASPDDVLPNGKAGTYFVNEQGDVDLFAKKILESIASAIVKEDVKGTFDITPGYEVGSVQINGKTIVPEDKLTDPTTQIRGTITQDGNKVTISVPESVFNPGDNKFTYNLVKTEAPTDTAIDPNVPIEEQEKPPADDYKAGTVTEEVGRLVGTFSVGEYTSPKIGDTAPTDVTYTDMAYCYPRVEKDVKDQDISNDKNGDDGKSGVIAQDELLPSRSSYAASLTSESEQFTYSMNYKMFNSPLEFKDNVKLLDKIDPRFDVKSVEVYEGTQKLDWNVTQTTLATGQTEVAVTVPKSPTPETVVDGTIVKATEYGGHVFKEYTVKIVAQLKDQYRYSVNASEYKKLMQDNGGLGAVNQATMSWDQVGLDTPQVRRSNSVYVQPPLETDIKKTVSISKDGSDRASEKTLNTRLQPYYYQITSTWPGVVGQYILEDTLVPELKVNNSTVGMDFAPTKDQVWITVDGIEIPSLQKFIKVVMDGTSQKVVLDIDSTKVGRTDLRNITREITAANTSNGPAVIELNINALIREDADLSKYAVDGKIKVPNDAKVTLDGNSKTSEKVYVTPDTPAVSKLIDGVDTLRNVNSYDQTFTYELIATLPSDIRNFNEYYIRDAVDPRLEITDVKISSIPRTSDSGILGAPFDPLGGSTTYLPQDYFTINQNDTSKRKADGTEANKQIITATLNADKFAVVNGGDMIRLIVTAKIKDGAKGAIENVATIHYTKDGEPPVDTPETPPVVVTPPPTITKSVNPVVEKRTGGSFDLLPENSGPFSPIIVKDGEKLEVGIWNDPFRFTVEAEVPFGSSTFKIEDPLEFAFQPYGQVASDMISGYDATRKVEIVDQSGNVVDTGYDLSKLIKVTSRIATAAESGIQQAGVDKNMYTMVVDFADAESTLGITHSQSLDLMHKIAGNKVRLTFDSQFKRYASLTDYVNLNTDGKPWVPNVANLVINDKSIPSNEVQVTPPINEPDISKTVDGVKNKDLSGPYQIFTYKIDTSIPYNATQFEVVDKLEPVLELITSPENFEVLIGDKVYSATDKVVVDGKERSIVTFDATSGNISVMLTTAQIEGNEGKTLSIRFSSRVKKNADLSKYRDFTDAKNQAHIPNEVTYLINNQPSEKKDTAEVAPPPPVPSTIVKKIEDPSTGKLVDDLVIENEKAYNYFVDITMPSNIYEYQAWQLEDVLDPRIELQPGKTPYLQFVGGGEPLDGQSADASDLQYYHVTTENVTVDGKDTTKILVKVNPEDMNKLHDKYHIRLVIPAQIKKDVLDKKIPNEATKHGVQPDGKDHIITTPPVYVTPPTPAPEPVKDVDGKPSLDLSTRDQEFEYHVKATVPDDVSAITEFTLYDDLEDILTVTGTSVTVAGQSDDKVSLTTEDGGKVTAALPKDSLANYAGKEVILTIKARIKAGVTNDELSKYVSTPEGSIPNKAKLTVGDNSGQSKETNNVPVTPPGETPTVEKKINGTLDDLDIANEKDYTYNIKSTLPVDITKYKSYVIVDTLDKDLAIQGTPSITGDAAKFFDVKVDGQTVTATMKDFANAKDFAGKSVELVITSQIKAGVTRQNIPNTAKVTYQDRSHVAGEPDKEVETPPVTVTPPGETPTVEKKINGTLDDLDIANEKDYTYNIKSTLPVDITKYKSYVIVDTLDKDLAIQGTPTITGDVAKFFDVKVDGQTVTATMKDFANAKDFAGKSVELVITSQIKAGVTRQNIPNTAKVTYQDRSHVAGEPDKEVETPPVTVTPPGETPTVEKKINGTLDDLDIANEKDYTYNIKSTLPVDITKYKSYVIVDTLDKDLAIQGTPTITGDVAKFFDVKVDGQTVTATMKDFANAKDFAGKSVELVITSQIKAGVTRQNIPNTAKVTYQDKSHVAGEPDKEVETPPVTVTPPGETPTVEKKINGDLDDLDIANEKDYTYNIKSTLPVDITKYKSYVIVDTLDKDLAIQGTPTITGDVAKFFDVKVDGQTVTATMKDFANAKDFAGKSVELVITSQIKAGVTRQNIPNTAKVTYQDRSHVAGEPDKEVETPPVTVTPPGETPTVEKKINGDLDDLDIANEKDYTYNIKSTLPVDITKYKSYVIVDTLDKDLAIQGTPTITGDVAKFFDVKVDGQTVTATMKDFANAKDFAGKSVELVITSQIKAGVTRQNIPNTAKVTYQDRSHVAGEPDKEVETPPVTVTPPGETPTVEKKINGDLDDLDIANEKDYTYNIKSTLPVDITKYKSYVIVDTLDKDLAIQGTPTITGDAAKFFDVKVDGQTVTATMKDFANAKDFAGKSVELVITSQIKAGVTRQNIPNTAKVTYQDRSHVAGEPDKEVETPPVTVTPPGETPTVEKKINGDLDDLDIANEKDYTYNIKSTLPVDITKYKSYVIVDTLDKDLAIQGTPSITGDVAKFFDVKVDGQTVTATMKDFANAKDFAGKSVELVITSQIKAGVTRQNIPNTAKVTYQDRSHVAGEPDKEVETPPVTVTPPGETPTVEKKINGDLDDLDIANEKDYTYNIKSTLPVDITKYKSYVIVDTLDKDLAIQGTPTITGDAAKFFDVKVDGQTVTATMKDFANAKDFAGKSVELVITSQIKAGVTRQNIPNTAKVTYQDRSHVAGEPDKEVETPPVTVTPPGETPTVEKKINGDLDDLDIANEKDYTYNIKSTLPVDITKYKSYVIVDTLDKDLAIQGTPTITGDAAKFFDVKVDGQTVTATMKDFANAKDFAGKTVELVISSQIRAGVTRQNIPNTAKVTYQDKSHVAGEPDKEVETPPVTVTPPGETPTVEKKINGDLDDLDIANEKDYTYNIKSTLPVDITKYKSYVIVDTLDKDLAIQGTPTITGDAAKFFDVKVDGQTVTATMKDFANAKDFAGKSVELVITSQIKAGVTRQNIPNTAKVTYQDRSHVAGEPDKEVETPPVTVTPPGETPTVEKKINGDLDDLDIANEKDYTYNIKSTLPVDITKYKSYVIVDTLDKDLAIQGTPTITGDAAKFFDVKVDGQTVTATMKDFANAKDFAGKSVELVITSQIKAGVTRQNIPNTAKVTYQDRSHVAGEPDKEVETPPVTVTPPGETPTVEKKINGDLDDLDIANEKDYTYNIKSTLPVDITKYKSYVIVDTLDKDLAIQGTPTITGDAAKFFDVKVDGQTVTATMKDFANAKDFAGKSVELVITSQIKAGVTRQNIPNTAKVTYQDKSHVAGEPDKEVETPPVTVTPPGETPTVEKKINGDLDDLDIANEKDYTYNIKSTLPVDITKYKSYVIVDTLDKDLAIQGTPTITGDAAKFFDVKVDGQTVTATMKDFANAKDFAGKTVELVISSQIRAGVTRQNIPNTAKVTYQDKSHVAGEPDKEVETPPVTVTPPTPDTPDLTKKVNKLEHADLANRQEPFTYTIDTTLPKNAFAFEVTDTLENVLSFDGDIKATVDGKNIPIEQVVTDGQKLSVKFTKEQLKAYAGQAVHIEFNAKVKDGADLSPYRNDKGNISVPNIANYQINNDPKLVKESNPVTITPPTPTEPNIDKKINRTETHLEIDRGKSYMYTINSDLPNDISSYKEYIISDTLDDALAINGPVEVHVDGYKLADSTFKVVTDGNHVTVTVKDFATLAGYKQIQLYIPSAIKEDFELDKAIYPDNKIPNTATVDFINSDGKEGSKESKPVTVTPPTPETPEVPEEPTPETPVKSVGHDDTDQSNKLILKTADEKFRFDVQAVVPTDKDEKNRIDLTHFNMSDTLDPNLMVARVAVEITSTTSTIPEANFNYIDEDLEKATQELKDAQAKLDEISKAATSTDTQKSVEDAQAKVTDLENKLAEAEAKLAELKTTEPVPTDGTHPDSTVDNTAAITAQEAIITDLKGQLATAKTDLTVAQKVLSEAKTPAEIKVELDNQQKLVDKAQEAFDKADAKAKEVAEKANLLAKLINQGELTASEMAELGISTAKSQGQLVNVEITDKDTLEALKGYTVKTIIYSSIKPGTDLKPYLKDGFENIATVSFNHGPNSTWTKDTKPVHVFPPKPTTPDKPVTPPPGETPPRRTPPTRPSRPILPRNGDNTNSLLIGFGALLAGLGFVGLKKKEN